MTFEKQRYGHLPYYELFSKHQSEWLNEQDWLKIVKTIKAGEATTK